MPAFVKIGVNGRPVGTFPFYHLVISNKNVMIVACFKLPSHHLLGHLVSVKSGTSPILNRSANHYIASIVSAMFANEIYLRLRARMLCIKCGGHSYKSVMKVAEAVRVEGRSIGWSFDPLLWANKW
jgi:hypothetical protein